MKIVGDDGATPRCPGTARPRATWWCAGRGSSSATSRQRVGGEGPAGREWFPTGDVAAIDADGYMQITDRSKDVIKSGGEWISSIDLENIAMGHPAVLDGRGDRLPPPEVGRAPAAGGGEEGLARSSRVRRCWPSSTARPPSGRSPTTWCSRRSHSAHRHRQDPEAQAARACSRDHKLPVPESRQFTLVPSDMGVRGSPKPEAGVIRKPSGTPCPAEAGFTSGELDERSEKRPRHRLRCHAEWLAPPGRRRARPSRSPGSIRCPA